MTIDPKSVAVGISIGFLLGLIVLIGVSNTPHFNTQDSSLDYTELHVAYGQRINLEIKNNTFGFEINYYYPVRFIVHSGSAKEEFTIEEGKTHQIYGIEIFLKESKSRDYLTLLIKPI